VRTLLPVIVASALAGVAVGVCAQPSGAEIYATRCVACHQAGGVGTPGLAPPLVANVGRHAASPEGQQYLVRVLLHGLAGSIVVNGVRYVGAMPQAQLSNPELVAVLAYVLSDIEKVDGVAWLTPEYVETIRRSGGSPNQTQSLRSKLPAAR
jgi:mono/diheme cytochrome c family protein